MPQKPDPGSSRIRQLPDPAAPGSGCRVCRAAILLMRQEGLSKCHSSSAKVGLRKAARQAILYSRDGSEKWGGDMGRRYGGGGGGGVEKVSRWGGGMGRRCETEMWNRAEINGAGCGWWTGRDGVGCMGLDADGTGSDGVGWGWVGWDGFEHLSVYASSTHRDLPS